MRIALEDQIRAIADESERQLDGVTMGPLPTSRTSATAPEDSRPLTARRGQHRWLVAAALVVVLGGGSTAAWVLSERATPIDVGSADDPVASGPPPIPENTPTVDADPTQMWLVASELPEGYAFETALEGEPTSDEGRTVRYHSANGGSLEVTSNTMFGGLDGAPVGEGVAVDIDGVEWRLRRTDGSPSSATLALQANETNADSDELSQPVGMVNAERVVRAVGLSDDEMVAVAARLESVPATQLPRPPLRTVGGVVVAETVQDGLVRQLRVHTDGRFFSTTVVGSGGPTALSGRWLAIAGAAGPEPGRVAQNGSAQSLVYGLLHPNVAVVEVELSTGQRIVAEPQDLYGFEENFFLVAFPTETEDALEQFVAVVVRDAYGVELASENPFD